MLNVQHESSINIIDENSNVYDAIDKYNTDYIMCDSAMHMMFFHILNTDKYLLVGGSQLVTINDSNETDTWVKISDPIVIESIININKVIVDNVITSLISDIDDDDFDDRLFELFQKAYNVKYILEVNNE